MLTTVLIIVLVVVLLGGLPAWGPAPGGWHGYGWYPVGGAGLLILILLILLLTGRL